MKKIICLAIACLLLFSTVAYADGFDLDVFRNEKSNLSEEDQKSLAPNNKQYSVTIDDMESLGFIRLRNLGYSVVKCNDSSWRKGDLYSYYPYYLGRTRYEYYILKPDIILLHYGENNFIPLPRIWCYYYGGGTPHFDTIIFRIGEKNYKFEDTYNSSDTYPLSDSCRYVTESVCVVRKTDEAATWIEFMDAWIENETNPITVRMKSSKFDETFQVPIQAQADTLLMFQHYKDAGGYEYLRNLM